MTPTPSRTSILQRIKAIAAGKINVDPALIEPDATLSDIGIDSFSLIELVFLAEEEFHIKIPFEGLEVKTVDDVLDVVQRQIAVTA